MGTSPPREISVLEPIGAAFEKTKEILFQPFDIGKWFILGFVVWLATLWERGGFNFNFRMPIEQNGSSSFESQMDPEFEKMATDVKMFVLEHLNYFIAAGVVIFLGFIIVSLLSLWLKSRFQFVFLHNIAKNKLAIAAPWSNYAGQGNSLFGFNLVLVLISMTISLLLIIPTAFLVIPFFQTHFEVIDIGKAVFAGILIFLFILVCFLLGAIKIITKDFIVPIMYIGKVKIVSAWKNFFDLFKTNIGVFILYFLFLILIAIVIGFGMALCMFLACCCLCFVSWVFLIPIMGGYFLTVFTLPFWVWRRAYSALFFAQFGPEFNVFGQADPVVVPSETIPPTPLTTNVPDMESNF